MSKNLNTISRIGFHYYPDTLHYSAADLHTWLPVLQGLGAGWLVLRSEATRAIPEDFLAALAQREIRPVIQFDLALDTAAQAGNLRTLFEVYARWGAQHVVFFQQPNTRAAWPGTSWAQQDLVERFIDRFLPLAGQAVEAGLQPVFPPLAPGGSYWDTAFLRAALEGLERRKTPGVCESLVLSAYAWTAGKPLDWGAGGPERWPQARPYCTPEGIQDQRGFRIYEWYLSAAGEVLNREPQILLLQTGLPGAPETLASKDTHSEAYSQNCLEIARMAAERPLPGAGAVLPPQVLAACFWLLSAPKGSSAAGQAWFPEDGPPHPLAARLQTLRRETEEQRKSFPPVSESKRSMGKWIAHYVLLPSETAGATDWYLEILRPFLQKYRPTLGFSAQEAERAARVTVLGKMSQYPAGLVERLRSSGCMVEQIQGTGTEIASILAER